MPQPAALERLRDRRVVGLVARRQHLGEFVDRLDVEHEVVARALLARAIASTAGFTGALV